MSPGLTPETRRPCRVLGPALRPECRDPQHPKSRPAGQEAGPRGEGPPGAEPAHVGNPPLPRQAFVLGAPAAKPRRPAPGQSSHPHPGPNHGRATFSVVLPLWGQGCAALSGGRPRGAYLGAGAADPARAQPPPPAAAGLRRRAQPRRLCSQRGSLRSRPGVTFALAPNPPTPPAPAPASRGPSRRGAPGPPLPALPSPPPLFAAAAAASSSSSRRSPAALPPLPPLSSLLAFQRPSPIAGEKSAPHPSQ